jgi:hypothetical protein
MPSCKGKATSEVFSKSLYLRPAFISSVDGVNLPTLQRTIVDDFVMTPEGPAGGPPPLWWAQIRFPEIKSKGLGSSGGEFQRLLEHFAGSSRGSRGFLALLD